MMKKLKIYMVLLLIAAACVDPFEGQITPAYEQYPVATLINMDSTFTQWVSLLKYTDLYNTMNLSDNYTCFIPNDQAMNKYLAENHFESVENIPLADAIYLVKYHTIQGSEYSQSLFDNGVIADTTATGDFLSIEIREGGLNAIYVNGEARISQLDVEATNGIIHVLETVLNPITKSIWETIDGADYSIFKEAIQKTGYDDELSTILFSETNSTTGAVTFKKKFFTLFAVSDVIYEQNEITSISELETKLAVQNQNYTDANNALNKYVAYHIFVQQLDFASLATFSGDNTSKNIETLATNELINFIGTNDALYLNYDASDSSYTLIIDDNIKAKNGFIHSVNSILEIKTPPRTTVVWEVTDYADVASIFSTIYRKSTATSTTTSYIEPGSVSCYSWSAIPSSNNDKAVAYLVANKNDAVRYELLNYDCLYLDLGLYGYVEMESPTIIPGDYTMKVTYYSSASATKYGKFMLILDENYVGSEITTHGASTTKAQIITATIDNVTFSSADSHTLRILAGDDSGIYIDHIEFVPNN